MGKNPNNTFTSPLGPSSCEGIVHSSGGEIIINHKGHIKQICPEGPPCKESMEWSGWAQKITRFDLDEYYKHYKYGGVDTSFDILDLGYWLNGNYYPPSQSFRRQIKIDRIAEGI